MEDQRRTDADIIRLSVGRPQLFELIFDRHFDAVHRFAIGRVGVQEAADVAAETFARAFDRRSRYRTDRPSALPWLFGIAANVGRERSRRQARGAHATRRFAITHELFRESFESEVTSRIDAERMRPGLVAALRELDDGEYTLLMLASESGLTYREIAEQVGIPIGTVRSRLSRARSRLRSMLAHPTLLEDANAD